MKAQEPMRKREELLEDASAAISGERNLEYGEPSDDFRRIADLWTTFFGFTFEPAHVAAALILMKCSRLAHCNTKRDTWLDIAGYAACGFEVVDVA